MQADFRTVEIVAAKSRYLGMVIDLEIMQETALGLRTKRNAYGSACWRFLAKITPVRDGYQPILNGPGKVKE
jgi:hypothetical protein